jgi:hypothetical protein
LVQGLQGLGWWMQGLRLVWNLWVDLGFAGFAGFAGFVFDLYVWCARAHVRVCAQWRRQKPCKACKACNVLVRGGLGGVCKPCIWAGETLRVTLQTLRRVDVGAV